MADLTETELKKALARAQALIHVQRDTIKKMRNTKLGVVAGAYRDEIDLEQEAAKAIPFSTSAGELYTEIIGALKFYAQPINWPLKASEDRGAKAREILSKLR